MGRRLPSAYPLACIAKDTRVAKALLEEYNIATAATKCSHIPVTVDQVLSPDAEFCQPSVSTSLELPWSTQKGINSYLLIKRSQKELHLLHEEMGRLLLHSRHQKELVIKKLILFAVTRTNICSGAYLIVVKNVVTHEIILLQCRD